MTQRRAHWSGRLAFVLAAAGSAVGLGNIWKFPYIAGVNGGGTFVLVYLACIAAVGVPIFIAELYIGQQAQKDAVESFEVIAGKGTRWRGVGWMGLLSAFLILSFYSVVGGWVLDFVFRSLMDQFTGRPDAEIQNVLGALFQSPWRQIWWHLIFMELTVAIVLGGVKDGIEKWNKILMPALIGLLLLLFVRAMFLPGFPKTLAFLFAPHGGELSAEGLLEAVGHSFFTLSLGMGAMITYGSYLKQDEDLSRTAFTIAFLDTAIALIAGIVIFSVVFSYDLEPGAGPTLMFQTLPMLFAKMPGGYWVSLAFFVLVAFAALSSAVSLLEVVVAYWVDSRGAGRTATTLVSGAVIFQLGILTALSTNVLGDVKIAGMTFFDLFDKLTSSVFLPLGGMLISLFFGWVLGEKAARKAVERFSTSPWAVQGLLWTTRVLAPLAVAVTLWHGISEWIKG